MIIRRGAIVFATIPGRNGGITKNRRTVVLSSDAWISGGGDLVLAPITSRISTPRPPTEVPISWDPKGHRRTSLVKPSVAVCDWLNTIPVADIGNVVGVCSLKELSEILKQIKVLPP